MATQIITSDLINTAVSLGTTDDLVLAAGRLISVENGIAINGDGSGHSVRISGQVIGYSAITLGTSPTGNQNNVVTIQSGGSVIGHSYQAIQVIGASSQVTNHGHVEAEYIGIELQGDNVKAINHGSVAGYYGLVAYTSANTAGSRTIIDNFGTVTGTYAAIYGDTDFDETINNFGTIIGDIYHDGGNDILLNHGLIYGNVTLGLGNDVYDTRTGEATGLVSGGDGNDTFKPGAGFDDIDGGLGTDTIDFRGGAAVQVALDGSIDGTGNANGDSYVSIDSAFGSAHGDLLIGSNGGNTLRGFGGADTIRGEGGADRIFGDAGVDLLTGDTGNDQFFFERLSDCGDIITDFGNALGDQDRIMIRASTFGGGLVAGSVAAGQFQARADNVAQDVDDRFIFRSTDKTLWFDVDGNGAAGPVMIADLQATATFTAVDIGII